MTRKLFRSTITIVCCIAGMTITAKSTLAFTAFTTTSNKLKQTSATIQLFAHHDRQQPPATTKFIRPDDLSLRRHQPMLPIPRCITTSMAFITVMMTFVPILPSNAGLLDEYGAGMTINSPSATTKSETIVIPTTSAKPSSSGSGNVQIDPTLRGSYYYPTAKKRYLPRILKASDALSVLSEELRTATTKSSSESISDDGEYNWDRVLELVAMVDDAVLPLQLYQSSLTGQGLSLSNEYSTRMKDAALRYERSAKQLTTIFQTNKKSANPTKAIISNVGKQEPKIQTILVDLKDAMNEYRTQGRLTDVDSLGIPSATPEEMRRMAMRSRSIPISTPP